MSIPIVYVPEIEPGIQRDGTAFMSKRYLDGQWVRFHLGKPRKIGGYRLIYAGNPFIIRTLYTVSAQNNETHVYMGRYNKISYLPIAQDGTVGIEVDRNPDIFPTNPNLVWQIEQMTVGVGADTESYILAAAVPSGNSLSNLQEGQIYWGKVDSTDPLIPLEVTAPENLGDVPATTAGGIIVVPPFFMWFGKNGDIIRSEISNPTVVKSQINVSTNKLVAAKATAAGGSTPSLLLWSLTGFHRGIFDPVEDEFTYSTLTNTVSILSSECIIEANQTYFWIGVDQFYVFNGVVSPLPNDTNRIDFFDNLNRAHAHKVFGVYMRKFKELWWYYPRGENTENSHVIIFSLDQNCWFDSVSARAAGVEADIYPYPLLSSSELDVSPSSVGNYGLWEHEVGANKVAFGQSYAIESYYTTAIFCLPTENPQLNRMIRIRRVEPDFDLVGEMSVSVEVQGFAQGPVQKSPEINFDVNTTKVDFGVMGRLVSFTFRSNERDGFYQMGRIMIDWEIGDVRPNE